MNRNGIDYPSVVDLVTDREESVQLVLVESRRLVQADALALQEKLNNYLSYALDGKLASHFPAGAGKPTCIRVDLYSQPDGFVIEFLRKYSRALISHGVSLEVNINGKALS
jgi:hypothetical protein